MTYFDRIRTRTMKSLGAVIAGLLTVAPYAGMPSAASAQESSHLVEYHAGEQTTIYCPAGFVCEVVFAPGEKLLNAWSAQQSLWSPQAGIKGGGNQSTTPVFTVKPEVASYHGTPLMANLILTTSAGRDYHLLMIAYDPIAYDSAHHPHLAFRYPLYTTFAYDDEQRAQLRRAQQAARRQVAANPAPTPTPPQTIAQQMDAACAAMPSNVTYHNDMHPDDMRPQGLATRNYRAVCANATETYIQLTKDSTTVPTVLEQTNDGNTQVVNFTYDATARIFRVDGTANAYQLTNNNRHLTIHRDVAAAPPPNKSAQQQPKPAPSPSPIASIQDSRTVMGKLSESKMSAAGFSGY